MDELQNNTFNTHLKALVGARLASDFKSAAFIADKLDETLSIGFFGDDHVDLNRPDSIGSLLTARLGTGIQIYRIAQG